MLCGIFYSSPWVLLNMTGMCKKVSAPNRFALPIEARDSFPGGYSAWCYNHYIGFISHTQSLEQQGLRFLCMYSHKKTHCSILEFSVWSVFWVVCSLFVLGFKGTTSLLVGSLWNFAHNSILAKAIPPTDLFWRNLPVSVSSCCVTKNL